ncbi:MAG: MvdC/MvdD family ATP grasp protein [Pseudomonadota bacterium]
MILIITFAENDHVERVLTHLTQPYALLDLADFPQRARLHALAGPSGQGLYVDLPDGRRIDLDQVGAIWNRRVRSFDIDPGIADPTGRLFAWSETTEAVGGLWHALDCFWMNHPNADEAASRKIAQLRVAERMGLRVPDTLVTNGPDEARAFVERHAATGVIRKAFRNIPEAPRSTLKVGPQELAQIEQVRFAPVIFQEYIPLELDIRVTVVGDDMFATAFRSEPAYEVDYRAGIGSADVFAYTLPDDVRSRLQGLMAHFGLAYGAVDFRVTPEGEHVFFEVNPAGEYVFAASRTGQPVPQAIAALLDRHAGGAGARLAV